MHVFLALPRCLGSWAACCGGSVFCVSSVFGHPAGVPAFLRVKNAGPKKRVHYFSPYVFPAFWGCVTEGAHYLGRSRRGIWSPPCRCLSSSLWLPEQKNTRNIVGFGVVNSSTTDVRVNGAFAFLGKNGQKTLQK